MPRVVEKPKRNSQIVRDLQEYVRILEKCAKEQSEIEQHTTACLIMDIKDDIEDILHKQ